MQNVKGTKRIAVAGFLAGILILGGCGQQPGAPPQMGPPEVAVVTIQTQRVLVTTELAGRTSPHRVAEVRPQVSGLIQQRLFTEGADVKAGQALYRIDPEPFQAALDSAEANLATVQKNAERTRAALQASLAGVTRQRATLGLAEINRKRFEDAYNEKAVSAGQRDQAVTEHEVALAALKAAEAQVESDRTAIAAADAAIRQAEAARKSARINIGYTTITAPISGRIGRSGVTEGALVTGLQPAALTTIQQLDPMYVDVPQSTAELQRLRKRVEEGKIQNSGQTRNRVRLFLEEGTPYPQEGSLQFRDVTVDPMTGSVILRVIVPNPKGVLLPGMFIRAVMEEGIDRQAILIPQQAVSRDPRGTPFTWVVNANGEVQQRLLTLDRAIGDTWLVTTGLAAGERVIVEGIQRVRPGVTVKAVPYEAGVKSGKNMNAAPPAKTN